MSGFAKLSVEVISTRHRFSFIKVVRRCHPVDLEEYGHFDLLAYKASYDQDYLAGRKTDQHQSLAFPTFRASEFPSLVYSNHCLPVVYHGRSTGFCQTFKRKGPLLGRRGEIENKVLHNDDEVWICRIQ